MEEYSTAEHSYEEYVPETIVNISLSPDIDMESLKKAIEVEEEGETDIQELERIRQERIKYEEDISGFIVSGYEPEKVDKIKIDKIKVALVNFKEESISFFDSNLFKEFILNTYEETTGFVPLNRFKDVPVHKDYVVLSLKIITRGNIGGKINIISKRKIQPAVYSEKPIIHFYFKRADIDRFKAREKEIKDMLASPKKGKNVSPSKKEEENIVRPDYEATAKFMAASKVFMFADIERIKNKPRSPTKGILRISEIPLRKGDFHNLSALKFEFGGIRGIGLVIYSYVIDGLYQFKNRVDFLRVKNDELKNPEQKIWKKEKQGLIIGLSSFQTVQYAPLLAGASIPIKDLSDEIRENFSEHLRNDILHILVLKTSLYTALQDNKMVVCFGMTNSNKSAEFKSMGRYPKDLFPNKKWQNLKEILMITTLGTKIS